MHIPNEHTLYTIGHSTHRLDEFIAMLQSFGIKTVADIRRFPGSRKFPQFDKENLEAALQESGIQYLHLRELGGRRNVQKDSKNTRWRNASFRGYADYMETEEFVHGITLLEASAVKSPTAYMCSEAVWWRCHRALISDYLKAKGWTVLHIMGIGKAEEHPYTSPAIVTSDGVSYAEEDLFKP
ncbi:DUF488 domain-containing protein [Sphingobacterium sp. SGG-5]|uniref:DUF488 domain-containing protein n=1 Tax=Sphingobacterium sp. SGG-5 TaxID=2710881 RepID=UPI0013ED7C34|nr:DUF488 domain-containing protein [Sphingobacterium sp. SGG-5]NGM60614.1 DUF488 domain-containing protein [Sphingobacterium sp. SGG-5]